MRNNILYNNGTAIGIGNQNPQAKLDVSGDAIIHGVIIGRGGGSFPGNTALGSSALQNNAVGGIYFSTAVGSSALMSNTNGYGNTAIGSNTLPLNTTGYFNTAVGEAALSSNTTGLYNSALGRGALAGNTTGTNNTAIGFAALASNSSTFQNTAIGGYALNISTGPYNTAVGGFSLAYNTSGGYNVGIGEESMYNNTIGFYNSSLGHRSLYNNTTGNNNSSVGYNALFSNTNGNYNSAFGYNSLYSNITGGFNVSFGYNAGSQLTSGDTNIFLGYNTQPNISNTGSYQLNIGNWIYGNNGNIGIGISSPLASAKLEVAGNIKIIDGTQGSGKVLMSDASGLASWVIPTASSVTATGVIGGFENYVSKFGTGGVGLYGSQIFDNGVSVGIGTASPTAKLEVAGQIKITGGSPGSGEVLMSDASGLATWSSLPILTDYWSTLGNTGTIPGINFLGTSDNVNVVFKRNNQTGGLLSLGNTSWGVGALQGISSGISNTAEGYFSLSGNTTGSANTSNGAFSLKDNATGSGNTANGYLSLGTLNTGNYNTAEGYKAGWSSIGSFSGNDNTFLGANSTYSTTVSNATAVGANVSLNQSNTVILGSGANIGIGTASPTAKLELIGQIKIIDGSQGYGKVLMTDASGLASWQSNINATATGITGGVENYVSKFGTGGLGLYSSQIFDNGLQVSIGNNTPTSKFEVWSGAISLIHFRGTNNTALGNNAVKYTLTGNANTGIGSESLFTLTTGYSNSAFGYRSLRQNTTGFNNTAIGQEALYNNNGGSWNSAVGYQALYSNVSGINNIAEGPQALFNLSTGNNNIAIGYQSLRVVAGSSVSSNVAIGYQSLYSTTSSNQVAIGYQSLFSNTSGASNVAIGYQSLDTNTTGSNNTAIGDMSLGNTTGSNNTAIGASAGSGNTTGSNNITIGYATQLPIPTGSNQLNIGNWIYGSGGNIGIGVSVPSTKLELNSSIANTSGLKFTQMTSSSPLYVSGATNPLGVDGSGNVVPVQGGMIPVYTALGATPNSAINTSINPPTIGANYDKYFNISARQSFTVTDVGGNPYNCPEITVGSTNKGTTGCTATPWSTYVMTAQAATTGDRYGYQIMISDRTDAPFIVRGGMYSSANNTLMNSAKTIPSLWFKALTVPTNHSDWLYVNPGVDQNNNPISGGGNVGIGTMSPSAILDVDGTFKLGTNGTVSTAAGTCTIASTVISTTATTYTCSGIPASTSVAINCSASAGFTSPNTTSLYCRANGTVNQVICNTTVANSNSLAYKCMWMQ